ncbi:MAG: hypothetical protein LBP53_06800 [Candidatus Peribacteria bacterium]|nr:hypothetical protein [Candidatus Peribacteria bacterium]
MALYVLSVKIIINMVQEELVEVIVMVVFKFDERVEIQDEEMEAEDLIM